MAPEREFQTEPLHVAPPQGYGSQLKAADLSKLGDWLADWALPFGLIVYLALRGGGYDVLIRGEVGAAAWWLVLLGALAGVVPRARIRRDAWILIALAGAFAAWTTLGAIWSESTE